MEASLEPLHDDVKNVIANFPVETPPQLINLLRAFGYVNILSISNNLDNFEEKINKIETFAREDLPFLIEENETVKFYGIYSKIPQKFRILGGYKHSLMNNAKTALMNYQSLPRNQDEIQNIKEATKNLVIGKQIS